MPEYSNLFVCLMGMGTVFFGLICLIALTTIMGKIVGGRAVPAAMPGRRPGFRRRGAQPSGTGSGRLRRHRGGARHRHHGHPNRIHEKTVRGKKERAT